MRTDDLLLSFVEMMEESDLLRAIMNRESCFENAIKQYIEYELDNIGEFFEYFLERVRTEEEIEILQQIFTKIIERFGTFNETNLNFILSKILHRVQKIKNTSVFNHLLVTLVGKANVSSMESVVTTLLLKRLLERIKNERDIALIERMFYDLALRARKKWVRQVLFSLEEDKQSGGWQTPLLPKNCFFYEERVRGDEVVGIEVERQRHDVIYHRTKYKGVSHPKLLFIFRVQLQRIMECKVFAVRDALIRPETKLYHFPFSNVHMNGEACWNEKSDIRISEIHQLSNLPYLFLRSPSNDELYRGNNLREKFVTLQTEEFDEESLQDTGKTVKDVLMLKE